MKRFVTYLYEYDRTLRGRNVGFIRNDIRSDCCRIEIHIRGLERITEKSPIYIIVRSGDCIGIPAGEIVISQGVGNACLVLQGDYIGKTSYRLRDMQAVLIRYQHGKMLMGCYVQHPASDLLSGTFQVWEDERGADDDFASKSPAPEVPRGQFDDFDSESPASDVLRGQFDDSDSENPASDVLRGQFDDSDSENPASEESASAPTYKRIALTDIRALPAPNWHLCRNSFLVHGFFCYHYLILKTEDAPDGVKMYLGVPGTYSDQERMMALLFGFNDFEVVAEKNFGYWLCPLEA